MISFQKKQMQVPVVRDIIETQANQEGIHITQQVRRKQSQTLVQLARSKTFQQGSLDAALKEITEAAAKTLSAERVSVWLYNQDGSALDCMDLYDVRHQAHTCGYTLLQMCYPVYFQTLEAERCVAVNDAVNDERTKELFASYLSVFGVASLLDAPIRVGGRFLGVVCHEHCGEVHYWTPEDEYFAASIADFVSIAIEASERNTAQKALHKSKAQFKAIFELSSVGIGLVDMKAQIVDVNPALCKILGYQPEDLYGKRFTDYIHQQRADIKLYKQFIREIRTDVKQLGEKPHLNLERTFVHRDGRLVWTKLSVSIIPGSDGEPEYFLAIVDDITDRKEMEMKLRTSQAAAEAGNRAKSEFLATMSHELRTPLNAIMGLSQVLQEEIVGSLNEKQKEYIDCIYSSGEDLLTLINSILDLTKVEAGKEELSLVPLVVTELCHEILFIVSDRATSKGLKLTHKIDPQANICIADERCIKQMLLNLLTNAIKFTPAGEVSLVVEKVSEGITFTVSDTGIGIDKNQFELLFEPFKQLDSRLNRQYEGTGLGLALTSKLARLHGGDVTVKSTVGRGSEFTLYLPQILQ